MLCCTVARGPINYLQDLSPSLPSLSMGRGRQVPLCNLLSSQRIVRMFCHTGREPTMYALLNNISEGLDSLDMLG